MVLEVEWLIVMSPITFDFNSLTFTVCIFEELGEVKWNG